MIFCASATALRSACLGGGTLRICCARRFEPMAEGWIISARVVVNDLLTDSGHCWQRFTTAIARKIKLVRAYGKPGIWNADSLFADRWSCAVLLSAGYRGIVSVVLWEWVE